MSARAKMLFVDDDENILRGYRRSLRREFDLDIAIGGEEGIRMLRDNTYAVVVSDYKMPGMNGVDFLTEARQMNEDTVRVMLTGQAEMDAAIRAINEGNIYRFLSKPCPSEELIPVLQNCIRQHDLIQSEKVLLEQTLQGSAKLLVEILGLVSPLAFSCSMRLKNYVEQIVNHMGVERSWEYDLSAMLSHIGCVSLPEDLVQRAQLGQDLSEKEEELFQSHPKLGADLIASIPRLESVAAIIANQNKHVDGFSEEDKVDALACMGSQILKVAIDFDVGIMRGKGANIVASEMAESDAYNVDVISVLPKIALDESESRMLTVKPSELALRMSFAEDVISVTGMLLVSKGQEVNASTVARFRNYDNLGVLPKELRVWVN